MPSSVVPCTMTLQVCSTNILEESKILPLSSLFFFLGVRVCVNEACSSVNNLLLLKDDCVISAFPQDILVGLLRLRKCGRNTTCPELMGKCSIVRELHVYGTAVPVHGRDAEKLQHQVKH